MKNRRPHKNEQGYILLHILLFAALTVYVTAGFVKLGIQNIRANRETLAREGSIQMAEAGIDYYRWHLAHAPLDFQDGTGTAGPYIHTYYDKDGNAIGTFSLTVTPPAIGSTLVTIESTGNISGITGDERTIRVKLAKPSYAKYSVLANSPMRFGEGTEVFGPLHSNNGIRFDGIAHNVVTSAVSTYDDPDHSGASEYAVHTHLTTVDPLPNAALPARTDVFMQGRQFPVPAIDFGSITANFSTLKTAAQTASGFYRGASGGVAYEVVLKTTDTFDLYRVNSFVNAPSGCQDELGQDGWGIWSVNGRTLLGTYAFPTNGLMFFEDHVFVSGQIDSARITIVAARLPDSSSTQKNIIINSNLRYTSLDGQDVIGLMAQKNILTGMTSSNDIRIDAAMLAQNGMIGRYYYSSSCSPYTYRNSLTLWGMIGTNLRYGFAYTDGTGYDIRNINYDGSLLYAPPPSYPLTTDQYQTLSWEEI